MYICGIYEAGLQCFYYIIFSFSPFLLTLRHSPGNSGWILVPCLCATIKCCVKLGHCILCTPLFMLDSPLQRESHGPRLGLTLPVYQELPSMVPDPELVLCTCRHARQRPHYCASERTQIHTHSQNKPPHLLALLIDSSRSLFHHKPKKDRYSSFRHGSEKHIITSLICTMACS